MGVLVYPVAETAEAALHAPLGHAERAREAEATAQGAVRFVTELVGPAFPTREAAAEAYGTPLAGGDPAGWASLAPVSLHTGRPSRPVRPVYRDGRRWPPAPADAGPLGWRLVVSYWRVGQAGREATSVEPARSARRRRDGSALDGAALNALARQPLRAFKPQQPLDVGLFEVRRPEAPDTFIPDE